VVVAALRGAVELPETEWLVLLEGEGSATVVDADAAAGCVRGVRETVWDRWRR
jgi:hypothetical protein